MNPHKPRSFAILSDIHVGNAARSSDLSRPSAADGKPAGYVDEFVTFVRTHSISPEAILISGDITDSAHPLEFSIAAASIEKVAKGLGLEMLANVIVVPGNHDVNWKALSQFKDDVTPYSAESRYYPLRFRAWPFDRMMSDGGRHLCEDPYFTITQLDGLLIVSLNSSSHDGPFDSPDRPHFGLAPKATIEALGRALEGIPADPDTIRLFLVHHHVVPRDDRARDQHDPSLIVNAEQLLEMLGAHRFDAVIHGHKHLPRVSSWLTTSNQPILVLGAGSFSATIEAKNAGLVQNYFHVLEIDHRDASDGLLRGRVKSWAYFIPDGWQAGPPVLGIDHVVPFGCYQPISTLAPAVQRVIDDRLNGGADHVLWRHILAAIPDLSYLHPNAARMLVEGLSVNGLISQGEVPDTIFIRP